MPYWRNRPREILREHQKNLSMSSLFTISTVVDFPTKPRTDGCQIYFDSFRILKQRLSFSTIPFNSFSCFVMSSPPYNCKSREHLEVNFWWDFLSLKTYSVPLKTTHHRVGYNVLQFSGTFFRFDYKLLPYM